MSDLSASIQIIQTTRPKITMDELVAMQNPMPHFEFNDHDNWFYTVIDEGEFGDGKTLEGNLICVTAGLPNEAEDLAHKGLLDSIKHFRDHLKVGDIETETRPIH